MYSLSWCPPLLTVKHGTGAVSSWSSSSAASPAPVSFAMGSRSSAACFAAVSGLDLLPDFVDGPDLVDIVVPGFEPFLLDAAVPPGDAALASPSPRLPGGPVAAAWPSVGPPSASSASPTPGRSGSDFCFATEGGRATTSACFAASAALGVTSLALPFSSIQLKRLTAEKPRYVNSWEYRSTVYSRTTRMASSGMLSRISKRAPNVGERTSFVSGSTTASSDTSGIFSNLSPACTVAITLVTVVLKGSVRAPSMYTSTPLPWRYGTTGGRVVGPATQAAAGQKTLLRAPGASLPSWISTRRDAFLISEPTEPSALTWRRLSVCAPLRISFEPWS
mmetsp:Transcript_26434/g.69497  ORF Transcript_26434/g.69497 Transcript_26434/m.69497 type:complete len:334 (+) Transcript_26434:1661-2662(+)